MQFDTQMTLHESEVTPLFLGELGKEIVDVRTGNRCSTFTEWGLLDQKHKILHD